MKVKEIKLSDGNSYFVRTQQESGTDSELTTEEKVILDLAKQLEKQEVSYQCCPVCNSEGKILADGKFKNMIVELKVIMVDGKSMTVKLNPEEIKKMKEQHNVSLLDETYTQIMEELNNS